NLTLDFKGITYNILYYPVTKRRIVKLPKQHSYEVSGNNIDGIIVTVSS
ncbi:D-Ala-D-Ala carboxypeptidase VanY, partial [Bacillus sp. JJ1764]